MTFEIVHFGTKEGHYLCNQAVAANPKKMSSDWKEVTCRNCQRPGGKHEM